MKKTLLNLALVATLASVSAQGISTTAAFDDFMDGSKFVAGNNPYAIETSEIYWNDTTKAAVVGKKAYMGIYWWLDQAADAGVDFSWVRETGKLVYSGVKQKESAYEPLGVGFGSYAVSAAATKDSTFTLDLRANKKVSLTIKNTSAVEIEFRMGIQDAAKNLLNGFKSVASEPDAVYKYEILYTVAAGATKELAFDFDTASYIYYTKNATDDCNGVGHFKTIAESGFDFSKVKAVVLTPLNATGTGEGTFPKCWGKVELSGGSFEITSFKLGDVSALVGVSDEIIANFKDEVVTVYNFSGAYVAQGNVEDLNLSSGLYIFKSASKAKKVYVK